MANHPRRWRGGVITILALCALSTPSAAQERDGARTVVRHLSFDGNRSISDRALRIAISTSRSSFFARASLLRWLGFGESRYLNQAEFRRDVLRIKALYGVSGFPDAQVDTSVVRSGDVVDITFRIEEGTPRPIRSLEITGLPTDMPVDQIRADLPLEVSRPFNRLLLQPSTDVIRTFARDRGYPYASVSASVRDVVDEDGVDVLFAALLGPKARIGAIEVRGTDRVRERTVRGHLAIEPGQFFSARKLYDSQLNLYRTGLFRSATVALANALPDGVEDTLTSIDVRVTEGPPQRLRAGAGYGTLDCLRAFGSWSHLNVLGGRSLQVNGRVSRLGAGDPLDAGLESSLCPALRNEAPERLKLNYLFNIAVTDPLFIGQAAASLSLLAERHTEFQAYLREQIGAEATIAAHLGGAWSGNATYGISRGKTVADAVTFCTFLSVCRVEDTQAFTVPRVRSGIGLGAIRDARNAAINATAGNLLAVDFRWAPSFIGSDSLVQSIKAVVEGAIYHEHDRVVVAARLRVGAALGPVIGSPTGARRYIPPDERFFGGGPNTVRGFTQNQLGPLVRVLDTVQVDQAGLPDSVLQTSAVGGNELIIMNAEVRVPFGRSRTVAGVVFVDMGRVVDRDAPTSGFRVTPGIGLRVASPVGPIRFDLGFNPHSPQQGALYERRGTELVLVDPAYQPVDEFISRFRLHFSIGQAF